MEGSSQLMFFNLPAMLRQVGKDLIPKKVIEKGYRPEHDQQVAVFGDLRTLKLWREEKGLLPENFPIHLDSKGLPHIDIYGDDISLLSEEERKSFIPFREYNRRLNEVKKTSASK